MDRFGRLVVRRPKTVLFLILCITLALVPGLLRITTRPALEGDLPLTDRRISDDRKMASIFPDRDFYLVMRECPEGVFTFSCLSKMREATRSAARIKGLSSPVESLFAPVYITKIGDEGVFIGPAAEDELSLASIEKAKNVVRNEPRIAGRFVSKDEKATLAWFAVSEQETQQDVHDALARLVSLGDRDHVHDAFGIHYLNQEIEKRINRDMRVLLPAALVYIAALICFTLVSQGILLFVVVLLLAILWCFGFMGWIGMPQSVLTGAIPPLLIAIASSAGIHLIHRMRLEYREDMSIGVEGAVEKALSSIGFTILLTGFTSAIGFGTLYAFRIMSIREFGYFAGLGIMNGTVLSLTLMPAAIVAFMPSVVTAPQSPVAAWFERVNLPFLRLYVALVTRWRRAVILTAVFACIIGVCGITRLCVGSNPVAFFPKGDPIRESFDRFLKHFEGDGIVSVMVDSGKDGGVYEPRFLERVARFEAAIEAHPQVVFGGSIADIVSRMHAVFEDGNLGENKFPDNRKLVAQYLFLYELDAPDMLSHLVDIRYRYLMIDFLIDANDSAKIDTLYWDAKALVPGIFGDGEDPTSMGGKFFIWSAQTTYIVWGKIWNAVSNFPLIFIFCIVLAFRKVRPSLLAMVPVVLATVVIFGIMGFIGMRLDLANAAITSIIAGEGVDFSIHYLSRVSELARERGIPENDCVLDAIMSAGLPINYNCLANLGFLVLLVSSFAPVRNFGVLISLSLTIATAGSIMLVPALLLSRGAAPRKTADLSV